MSVIDDYLNRFSGPEKTELEKIRSIVIETVPETEEVITYGMPGFKYKGQYLIAFSVFKDHLGLFPTSSPIETLRDKLTGFKTSKGGIQFTPAKPIPESLVKDILVTRMNEISNMATEASPWSKFGPESYFPSIEKKYNRSIAEWQKIITGCGLEKHMEIVNHLKSEYKMGHGHANALVGWTLAGNKA